MIAATKRGSTVLEEFSYDPWGRHRNPNDWNDYEVSEPTLFTRGFTGHEHIGGFYGLINMNGRVYDARLGRFLSPDPGACPVFTGCRRLIFRRVLTGIVIA
ncbi:MAG: RHS repeat-associated core domain-containing protein [bacterium]